MTILVKAKWSESTEVHFLGNSVLSHLIPYSERNGISQTISRVKKWTSTTYNLFKTWDRIKQQKYQLFLHEKTTSDAYPYYFLN